MRMRSRERVGAQNINKGIVHTNYQKMLGPVRNILHQKEIIVASSSPSRRQLIEQIGLKVKYYASTAKEKLAPEEYNNFSEYVEKIAEIKVTDVEKKLQDEKQSVDIIIGADTIVVLNGQKFEKPEDKEEATATLKQLSGKNHVVYTGVIIKYNGVYHKFVAKTAVTFSELTEDQIEEYVASGEPYGGRATITIFVTEIDTTVLEFCKPAINSRLAWCFIAKTSLKPNKALLSCQITLKIVEIILQKISRVKSMVMYDMKFFK